MNTHRFSEPLQSVCNARFGWIKIYSDIYSDGLALAFNPIFPFCAENMYEQGIVWDPWLLYQSVKKPGAYFLLNSDCGYPPDSGIETQVLVSHPDPDTLIWELDIEGLRPALQPEIAEQTGFLRLHFARQIYEADLRVLLHTLHSESHKHIAIQSLPHLIPDPLLWMARNQQSYLPVENLEPAPHGDMLEELLALDLNAAWPREALLSPGTLELDIKNTMPLYKLLTRWDTLQAMNIWIQCHANQQSTEACRQAGKQLAAVLQACFDEGQTAPGVTVRYTHPACKWEML